MKEIKNDPSGWVVYIDNVKLAAGRELTQKEVSDAMTKGYILSKSAEDFAKTLKAD